MNYIIKTNSEYVSGDAIQMGIPELSRNLKDAKIFTEKEQAEDILAMICLSAEIIEV